jgi:hypothetical protein
MNPATRCISSIPELATIIRVMRRPYDHRSRLLVGKTSGVKRIAEQRQLIIIILM